jgi:hypothetical protein
VEEEEERRMKKEPLDDIKLQPGQAIPVPPLIPKGGQQNKKIGGGSAMPYRFCL